MILPNHTAEFHKDKASLQHEFLKSSLSWLKYTQQIVQFSCLIITLEETCPNMLLIKTFTVTVNLYRTACNLKSSPTLVQGRCALLHVSVSTGAC